MGNSRRTLLSAIGSFAQGKVSLRFSVDVKRIVCLLDGRTSTETEPTCEEEIVSVGR